MSESIGAVAGKLWQFLHDNGPSSPSKVTKEMDISRTDIQRAIGWLAREEKIVIEMNGRMETLSLK